MPRLTSTQAHVYAIIALVFTLACSLAMPGFPIMLTGLLVVIFLSVFIPTLQSTLIATGISILVTAVLYWYSGKNISQYLFIVLLIVLTTIIVLYVKRLYLQLTSEKSHMTALFENATEGIILTNDEGCIILVNAAAGKMFGYETTELVNKRVEILLPQKIREGHIGLRETFYKNPQHRTMGSGRDLLAQNKAGISFPVEVSLSYYYKGDKKYVIAFIVDITQRKQIEVSMLHQQQQLEAVSNELRNLNAELEMKVEERTLVLKEALQKLERSQQELSEALDKERQLNEIKSRFVSMASHEFRTPLSTVLSSASLLSKYTRGDEQDRRDKHIERIKTGVKHLNDILEDFLSLGKLDEGKVQTIPTPFALNNFIEDTIEDMKGLLKPGQKINYSNHGADTIQSDKKLLKNVLLNVISNAIKFSGENTTVSINSNINDGEATISITDQGLGISDEDQQHLFSSFFRGANAVNIQGTGLGLHIVKRYLELMGGSVALQSKVNEGTTFTITIPTNIHEDEQDNISNRR